MSEPKPLMRRIAAIYDLNPPPADEFRREYQSEILGENALAVDDALFFTFLKAWDKHEKRQRAKGKKRPK